MGRKNERMTVHNWTDVITDTQSHVRRTLKKTLYMLTINEDQAFRFTYYHKISCLVQNKEIYKLN